MSVHLSPWRDTLIPKDTYWKRHTLSNGKVMSNFIFIHIGYYYIISNNPPHEWKWQWIEYKRTKDAFENVSFGLEPFIVREDLSYLLGEIVDIEDL